LGKNFEKKMGARPPADLSVDRSDERPRRPLPPERRASENMLARAGTGTSPRHATPPNAVSIRRIRLDDEAFGYLKRAVGYLKRAVGYSRRLPALR
jgi:hypothetical protein